MARVARARERTATHAELENHERARFVPPMPDKLPPPAAPSPKRPQAPAPLTVPPVSPDLPTKPHNPQQVACLPLPLKVALHLWTLFGGVANDNTRARA